MSVTMQSRSVGEIVNMRPFLDTGVETFTHLATDYRGDMHMAFISVIKDGGATINVKPVTNSAACLNYSNYIKEKKILVGIEKKVDGIYMVLHHSFQPAVRPDTVLSVEAEGKVFKIGGIKATKGYSDERYEESYINSFNVFLECMK